MFAGRSTYIPLRLNNAGVISIIFAISILLLPQQALSWFAHGNTPATYFHLFGPISLPSNPPAISQLLNLYFSPNGVLYNIVYFLLVVIFTFFYSSVVLNTRDVADNLKKTGAFIPGIRPGQPTVDYLNKILVRITTAAAHLPRLAGRAPWSAAARPVGNDVLSRFDVAADRGRRGAGYDHANRSTAGDARLPRLHQEINREASLSWSAGSG